MSSTTTRSQIGSDDINFYDGISDTFIRKTSTGGDLTLNKIGYLVDVAEAYGSGAISDTALSDAIGNIGTTRKRTLLLRPGTWTINSDITIPSNLALQVSPGTTLSIASTKTLTINGEITAGNHQIFSGSGLVVMTSSPSVANAAWWGAVAGGTGQQVPICAALQAAKRVFISPGTYTVTPWEFYAPTNLYGGIVIPTGRELFGHRDRTIIKLAADANVSGRIITNEVNVPANAAARDTDIYIHDLTIDGNRANNASATQFQMGIEYRAVCRGKIENVRVYRNMGDAINIGYSTTTDAHSYDIQIKNVHGYLNNRNGISITGAEKVVVSDFLFEDCGLCGIDIEPDDNAYAVNEDISITNGTIRDVCLTNHLSTDIAYGLSIVGAGYVHPIIEKVTISNVTIDSVNGANGFGIVYRYVRGLTIDNCTIKDCENTAIETMDEGDALNFLGGCGTDWVTSKGTGWAYDAGNDEYDATAGSGSDLSYTTTGGTIIVVGQLYRVDFQVKNYSAGSVTPYLGTAAGTAVSADGYYSQYIYAAGNVSFIMRKDSSFAGSVDTMAVTRVTTSDIAISNCAILSGATGMILGRGPRNTTVTNCTFSGQTSIGLQCSAAEFVFSNNVFRDVAAQTMYFSKAINGVISGNELFMCYNGINIQEGVENIIYSNNLITACTNIGFYVNGTLRKCQFTNNSIINNATDLDLAMATFTNCMVRNNIGYVTENSGTTGAIASAADVAHGLSGTPTEVFVTPITTGPSAIFVDTLGATNFKINYTGAGPYAFHWRAIYRP